MAKGVKTGGRKAGTPNKLTGELKGMILKALTDCGGIEYLKRQAESNPSAFMTLIGKVLPLQVAGDESSPIKHIHRIEWVRK